MQSVGNERCKLLEETPQREKKDFGSLLRLKQCRVGNGALPSQHVDPGCASKQNLLY